ncbi:MAG TPA: hypothetical protein EYP78_04055 [Candidatus Omnitrophica bacterium]|nr:hypothetical protein [Candidatus Omnitrophota bacterium]
MVIWVIVVFLLGLLLTFGSELIISRDLITKIGLAITLISIGIAARAVYLEKRGEKETLENRIKELERKMEELSKES